MRDIYPKLAMAAAAAFSLSGCGTIQSIFGAQSARMPELKMSAPADVETAVAQATQEGRGHLDRGETGLAIEAFRRALSFGAPSAAALNGMGVAFARLGRYELARRYFSEASALDPSDERYAANLAHLNRSPAFAMRHDGDIAAAVTGASTHKTERAVPALASAQPQTGRLTRLSEREYSVRTVAPMQAPLIRSASVASSQFKPLVRIEFSRPEAFSGNPAAEVSSKATIGNPHLGRTAAVDKGFKPVVRFPLKRSGPAGNGD